MKTRHTFNLQQRVCEGGVKKYRFSDNPDAVFDSIEDLYKSRGLPVMNVTFFFIEDGKTFYLPPSDGEPVEIKPVTPQ
jgi:hypothetical protein